MGARRRLLMQRHIHHTLDHLGRKRRLAARPAGIPLQPLNAARNVAITPAIDGSLGFAGRPHDRGDAVVASCGPPPNLPASPDPQETGRCGYIKLNPSKGLKVGPADITENPKKFNFIELDAAQLPRSLDDTDASAVNTNYALQAGLDAAKDPILKEGAKAPYINLVAVRTADKDAPWVAQLVQAYHSPLR
jgi:hypothetical protein